MSATLEPCGEGYPLSGEDDCLDGGLRCLGGFYSLLGVSELEPVRDETLQVQSLLRDEVYCFSELGLDARVAGEQCDLAREELAHVQLIGGSVRWCSE